MIASEGGALESSAFSRIGSEVGSRGSEDSNPLNYRADIDGLRGIAVLSVILFHLSRTALPGGYLGVDIFFVLSGFLITSIVHHEVQSGDFSILYFYERRIRRILPALLLVLGATTIIGALILLPADLIGYGKSLLATLTFTANIYFWRDTNYFARAAEQKPLLHMWSLGVEEQFYIFFPLVIVLLVRYLPRAMLLAVSVLTILSFGLNVLALRVGGASPAFFLLPTRVWELGLGAIVALLPEQYWFRPAQAGVAAFIGLILVFTGIVYPFSPISNIPEVAPAVVGAALLALSGRGGFPRANRWLGSRPLVSVGLISYSLYLWHWPIFVLLRYYFVTDLSATETAAALALTTACAVGSWRYVETPFRRKRVSLNAVLKITGGGVCLLAGCAGALIVLDGLPARLDREAGAINEAVDTNYRCPTFQYVPFGLSRACLMNLPSRNPEDADAVLLGNSHAQMYAPLVTSILADHGWRGLLVPANGCLPTPLSNISQACAAIARQNLDGVLALPRLNTVIIGLNWRHDANALVSADGKPLDNNGSAALIFALDDLIDEVRHSGKNVVLIGPIALPGWDVASILSRQLAFGRRDGRQAFFDQADFERFFGPAIAHFRARGDIRFITPHEVQCRQGRCEFLLDGRSLYSDSNHLAAGELWRFRHMFNAAFEF
ncbi:acyltransferase [Methylocystis sp. H4A]|uniref:acyltransferase family protein n=1 Tax=Methylocystis sp. H4A TaxID=2785788 RepID=UPI0018C20AF8|nr:acyltransferase family protein [Methylocystis sp. H4A]MBG0799947.1 acyltransferase [Methylocystis sp. H4A]